MSDFQAPPWWKNNSSDYTKSRSGLYYNSVNDIIGRKDTNKFILTTTDPSTVSGTSGTVLK